MVMCSRLGNLFIVAVCFSEHFAGSLLAGVVMHLYEIIPPQYQAIRVSSLQLLATCEFGLSSVIAGFLLA